MRPGKINGEFVFEANQLQPIAEMLGWDPNAFKNLPDRTIGPTAGSYLLLRFGAIVTDPDSDPKNKTLAHQHLVEYFGATYLERLSALEQRQAKRGLKEQMLAGFSIFKSREPRSTRLNHLGQPVPDVSG